MRTNEERIRLMHQRASQIEEESRDSRIRVIQAASFSFTFALVIVLAFAVHHLSQRDVAGSIPDGMIASVFTQNEALGYVVIAAVAFLLGVCVTVFCYYIKRHNENKA